MSVFRYYLGYIYIVVHKNKGFWNQDKKKYVNNMKNATFYKNRKCAEKIAKKIGRITKVISLRIELPDYW